MARDRKTNLVLGVSTALLAALNVLIWRNVVTYDVTTPLERESIAVTGYSEVTEVAQAPVVEEGVGDPVRIMIPRIAVDAAIEEVTLAADGSMGVPTHPDDTAWYSLGPRPGETGSAAIAGHVDRKNGKAAVFADLHKVRAGDKIAVRDDKGATTYFSVREARRYDPDADAFDVFISDDGRAHLNIITCDGAWDKIAKGYSKRLVVFADKETE